ncbi:DUF1254 domain-containing protein [Albimonas sp. CAU 1670]|uniref:DUF1214 domain-containing protein n=1 Tax=Albimonas sp. CAU 1670 TaxID=3032599 RepID=UPI0023DC643D|nr:DUF1214 domain-containing protein [Albimonas sp. CAU 1670]MDF2235756.1 DUF1254 domain-containing protein [Albimonas sp. CAU 1670]
MISRPIKTLAAALTAIGFAAPHAAMAQVADDNLDALVDAQEIPVTLDNFVRAATDIEFDKYVALAGGVNRFFHFRELTPVEAQTTVSMNRDTLYSAAIVDISQGATLTLPDVGGRYMSAMIVNQDHYLNEVFHGGGSYTLDVETFDTPYVAVYMRVLVDASDPADVAAVHAIQDAMSIEAASAKPFIPPIYDEDSYEGFVRAAVALGPYLPSSVRMFGRREEVDPVRHLIGTAGGWGGLPETEALYVSVSPGLPVGEYRIEVPAEVPVGAFWSVSLYDAARYFVPNPLGAYVVNSVSGARNADGSMTVHLGGCEDGRVNCLPLVEGWQYTIRLYQPGPEILNGSWSFPPVQPIN